MANTLIQLKRSAVPGKVPNTSTLSTGELALNLADKKLFSSDGTNIFEMNANNANNSSYLGGVAAASYVQNTDSRTLSGNLYFTGANVYVATSLYVGDNSYISTTNHFVGNSTVNTNIAAGSISVNGAVQANNSGFYPSSNSLGTALGNTTARWVINSNTINASGLITGSAGLTISAGAFTASMTGSNFTVNSMTTGVIALGGPTQTGAINLGVSTANQTVSLASGATTSGNVKTLNIGTAGAAGSTTNVNIGTALSNSFITINANTANINGDSTVLSVGNSSVYTTINSTAFSGSAASANNASYLGGTAAASYVQNTDSRTLSGNLTFSGANLTFNNGITINNDKNINFQTVNASAYVTLKQQSDDNFVMYSTNSTYGQRPIWSVFANSDTSAFSLSVPAVFNANATLGAVIANNSIGTAGQVLTTSGTGTYWATVTATAVVNQAAQYTWTNTQTFSANISFTGNGIGLTTNTGAIYFNGLADANWKIGRSTGATTKLYYTNNSLDIIAAASNLEGFVIGQPGGNTYLETGYAGTFTRNSIFVGNSTINTAISPTTFSAFSNSTVNSVINSTSITISNTTAVPFVANASGVYTTGVANAATHSSGAGFTANSTLVNAAAINVTGAVNTATLYAATSANIASVTLANATGVYTTGTVNAATHTSGSGFIANSTAIVGTGYANITTSVNSALITAGANVFMNATTMFVSSNSTVNTVITAGQITLSGQTINSTAYTGLSYTANNSSYLGGVAAASYVTNTGAFTISGVHTYTANVIISPTAGLSANGSFGTSGQVLLSNASTIYWANSTNLNLYYANGTIAFNSISATTVPPGGSQQLIFNDAGTYNALPNLAFDKTTSTLSVNTFTANSSLVNTAAINVVGQVNTATLYAATSANLAGTTTLANTLGVFTTGTINAASHTIGSTLIANTLGVYHTGTMNAASFSVGTAFTANSTLVNAAAVSIIAGNTTSAPLRLTTGTLTTSASNGTIEFVNPTFYATPTNSARAAIATPYLWVQGLSVARTAQIAAQGIFGAAGTSTLAINLGVGRYRYALFARYTSTAVATNFQYALGGTAVLGFHAYQALTKISITSSLTSGTSTQYSNARTSAFTTLDVISATSTAAASFFDIQIDGIIDVTTAGTVIFQEGQSGATAVLTLQQGSFVEIFPYGAGAALGAANTNIGGWA